MDNVKTVGSYGTRIKKGCNLSCWTTISKTVFLLLCRILFACSTLPYMSPLPLSLVLVSSPLYFSVESTTVEFVLLPLIRLVLIFLPPCRSSAEWMNFFNCLSEPHLHCSAQRPRGLLPAIYYEIKINGCWNVILWPTVIETNDDFLLNRIWNVSPTGALFQVQSRLIKSW